MILPGTSGQSGAPSPLRGFPRRPRQPSRPGLPAPRRGTPRNRPGTGRRRRERACPVRSGAAPGRGRTPPVPSPPKVARATVATTKMAARPPIETAVAKARTPSSGVSAGRGRASQARSRRHEAGSSTASTVIFAPANSRDTGHSSLASPATASKSAWSGPGTRRSRRVRRDDGGRGNALGFVGRDGGADGQPARDGIAYAEPQGQRHGVAGGVRGRCGGGPPCRRRGGPSCRTVNRRAGTPLMPGTAVRRGTSHVL